MHPCPAPVVLPEGSVCFSAQADLIGGVAVSALGIDALRHVHRPREVALAGLPLLLGLHQLVEAFVWWGLQGNVTSRIGDIARWVYLLVAFVVLPVLVPVGVMSIEPVAARRRMMALFAVVGTGVSLALAVAMARGPVTAQLRSHHIAYGIGLQYGFVIVSLYVLATCGSLLASSHRSVVVFGAVNLAVVGVLAWFQKNGFASLWCAWAAVTSVAIVAHLRGSPAPRGAGRPRPAATSRG